MKNQEKRLIVLSKVASSVIAGQRYKHKHYVFTYEGRSVQRMNKSGWKKARLQAASRYEKVIGQACPEGFRKIRVHDLKHTFGRRLRAAEVSFEDRQDLLGHIRTNHDTLFGSRIRQSDRCCQPGLRSRILQKSRTGHASLKQAGL